MSRYIDAETLVNSINNLMTGYKDDIITLVKFIPTADVAEVKHGEWIYKELDKFKEYSVKCSKCSAEYIGDYDQYCEPSDFNYCPNCGAKMGEGKTDENS